MAVFHGAAGWYGCVHHGLLTRLTTVVCLVTHLILHLSFNHAAAR